MFTQLEVELLRYNIMHIGKVDETERNLICYCTVLACLETTENTASPLYSYFKNIIEKQRIYLFIKNYYAFLFFILTSYY